MLKTALTAQHLYRSNSTSQVTNVAACAARVYVISDMRVTCACLHTHDCPMSPHSIALLMSWPAPRVCIPWRAPPVSCRARCFVSHLQWRSAVGCKNQLHTAIMNRQTPLQGNGGGALSFCQGRASARACEPLILHVQQLRGSTLQDKGSKHIVCCCLTE